MSQLHLRRKTCRLCDSSQLELVVPITPTPIAGAFVRSGQLATPQPTFPLDLYMCGDCRHVQLVDIVDPAIIFSDEYSYASGSSPGLVRHFGEYATRVCEHFDVPPDSLVIDVGSNDGTFLKFFRDRGCRVLGIEPAEGVAQMARDAGIETLQEFLSVSLAERLRASRGPATVVTANNVFAHMDDLAGAATAVRKLLDDAGVFLFEVSYLLDVIDHMLLGSIFHEHLSYHSVKPLVKFLRRHGMQLTHVWRETIQGGSLICAARPVESRPAVNESVREILTLEETRQLDQPATLRAFSQRLETVQREVHRTLLDQHQSGQTIAAFGAARGGTLLIYHFGLGEMLQFIVDDSPDKQGTYSPGFHIPVLPTAALYERHPDYVLILAWVHAKPIVRNHLRFLDEGGRFVIFSPEVRVITREDNPWA